MPLKLNIGLNKKIGEANYGSRGASINVELEVDSSLIAEPAKFQERVRQVFSLVRTSLAEELNGNGHTNGEHKPPAPNGNGSDPNGQQNGNRPRQATQSQVRAINSIARNQRLDLAAFLSQRFRVNQPENLTIKEASLVIDELKNPKQGG